MAFLKIKEAAERLNVSSATLYHLCAEEKVRHIRVGSGRGTIRIDESALDEFIQGATVQPEESPSPSPRSPAADEATSSSAGAIRRFQHVRYDRLPDSPPDARRRS